MADSPPAEELNQRADEILSRPEFLPPSPTLWDRITDWFLDLVGDLLDLVGSGGGQVVGWIVIGVIVALLIYAVVKLAPRRLRGVDGPMAEVAVIDQAGRTRAEWQALALKARDDGDWSEAVRCWFRATVSGLGEAGVVPRAPGATNAEHRAALVSEQAPLVDPFDSAARRFEDIYYGGHPAELSDDEHQAKLDSEIIDGARQ